MWSLFNGAGLCNIYRVRQYRSFCAEILRFCGTMPAVNGTVSLRESLVVTLCFILSPHSGIDLSTGILSPNIVFAVRR